MKLKLGTNPLLASFCLGLFILLHVSYYAGSTLTEREALYGMAWEPTGWLSELQELPRELLTTPFDGPLTVSQLEFCAVEGGPRYWNPFRGITYRYSDANAEVEECNLLENSNTLAFPFLNIEFSQKGWDAESYWQGYETEGFMRGLVGLEVPNLFFFLIQYGLMGGFLWNVLRKSKKD